jgi:hypothetical protein
VALESDIYYNTLIEVERRAIENPKIETVIRLADALEAGLD